MTHCEVTASSQPVGAASVDLFGQPLRVDTAASRDLGAASGAPCEAAEVTGDHIVVESLDG